jgi:hypothetical protein
MNEIKIQWHPGFVAAVNLELAANRNDLNTKPLEIDLLVIKKDSHVQITNEIGRLFKGHNILEYQSPEDHLDIFKSLCRHILCTEWSAVPYTDHCNKGAG